jgi:general secretion pathway protein F
MAKAWLPPLSYRIRADLYSQLARMEIAGLPFDQSLALIGLARSAQPRVAAMKRWIGLRLDIADAGLQSGLFTPMEAALIRAAISAGTPGSTYLRLADRYRRRVLQITRIKSRLALPVAVFIMAAFIGPIPALASGALSTGGYLFTALRPLLLAGTLAWLLAGFPRWSEHPSAAALRSVIDNLLPVLPLFGAANIRRNLRDFFESLGLLLDAGVPMLSALPLANATIRNLTIRQRFSQLQTRIEGGLPYALALKEIPFPGRERAFALMFAAENAGALPDTLLQYADFETDALNDFDDNVADWAPRLVYTLVAGWMAHSLLTGAGLGPSVPKDL